MFTQIGNKTVGNTTDEISILQLLNNNNVLNVSEFQVGGYLRVECAGFIKRQNGPLVIKVKLGSTTILTTGEITPGANSVHGWTINIMITFRAVGVNGRVMAQGYFTSLNNGSIEEMISTTETPINLSANQAFDITAKWSNANVNDTITCTNIFRKI